MQKFIAFDKSEACLSLTSMEVNTVTISINGDKTEKETSEMSIICSCKK